MPKTILDTPSAAKAVGPYSAAVEAAGLVFISGQVGAPPSGEAPPDDVVDQAHQVMKNIGAILEDVGLGFDDIVKSTIFLASIDDFAEVNEVYASYLGSEFPARSTFQAGALPGGFKIEIEVVAAR